MLSMLFEHWVKAAPGPRDADIQFLALEFLAVLFTEVRFHFRSPSFVVAPATDFFSLGFNRRATFPSSLRPPAKVSTHVVCMQVGACAKGMLLRVCLWRRYADLALRPSAHEKIYAILDFAVGEGAR